MRSFYRKAIEKIKEDPSYEIMEIKHFEDGLKVVSDNLKAYYKKYMIDDMEVWDKNKAITDHLK